MENEIKAVVETQIFFKTPPSLSPPLSFFLHAKVYMSFVEMYSFAGYVVLDARDSSNKYSLIPKQTSDVNMENITAFLGYNEKSAMSLQLWLR